MNLLHKYVWLERLVVLLGNVGINLGIMTTTQESNIAAGGAIAVVTVLQVVAAFLTHYKTAVAQIETITTELTKVEPMPILSAAQVAGKAATNG